MNKKLIVKEPSRKPEDVFEEVKKYCTEGKPKENLTIIYKNSLRAVNRLYSFMDWCHNQSPYLYYQYGLQPQQLEFNGVKIWFYSQDQVDVQKAHRLEHKHEYIMGDNL